MKLVTDPEILKQFHEEGEETGLKKVTDPDLIQQFNEAGSEPDSENKEDSPSFGGSFVREAGRSVLPGTVGVLGGAAAAAGTAALVTGPLAPIAVPVAGLAGGIYAGMKAREYQDKVADETVPDSFMGTKSAQSDVEAHPVGTFLGSLIGTGKPSASALGGAIKAFGTTAGRQGIKTIAKQIGSKEAREAVKKATTETIEGTENLTPQAVKAAEAQKVAGEHFGHAIGSVSGVGAMTGMGIAQGEDPGTAALKGVAGLAVKPWVGPGGVFLDPVKASTGGQVSGDNSKSKSVEGKEEQITGTSEELLGDAESKINEVTDSAIQNNLDAGNEQTAKALAETATTSPAKEAVAGVEDTATQTVQNKAPKITDAARRKAEELGVDITKIPTNKFGNIAAKDVVAWHAAQPKANEVQETSQQQGVQEDQTGGNSVAGSQDSQEVADTTGQSEVVTPENKNQLTPNTTDLSNETQQTQVQSTPESIAAETPAADQTGVLPEVPVQEPVVESPAAPQAVEPVAEVNDSEPTVEEPEEIPEHAFEEQSATPRRISADRPKGKTARIFVSPNTDTGLTLDQAVGNITGQQHASLTSVAQQTAETLPVKLGRAQKEGTSISNAVGTWADGGENSLLLRHNGDVDPEALRATAATLGAHGNQKQVLTFQKTESGPDELYEFTIPGKSLPEAAEYLDNWAKENGYENGFGFRTLESNGEDTKVSVVNRSTINGNPNAEFTDTAFKVKKFTDQNGLKQKHYDGLSESLGDPEEKSVDVAKQHYAEVIRQYLKRARAEGTGGMEAPGSRRGRKDSVALEDAHRHRLWELSQDAGLDVGDRPEGLSKEQQSEQDLSGLSVSSLQPTLEELQAAESKIPEARQSEYQDRITSAFRYLDKEISGEGYSGYPRPLREQARDIALDKLRIQLSDTVEGVSKTRKGKTVKDPWVSEETNKVVKGIYDNAIKQVAERSGLNEKTEEDLIEAENAIPENRRNDYDAAKQAFVDSLEESISSGAFAQYNPGLLDLVKERAVNKWRGDTAEQLRKNPKFDLTVKKYNPTDRLNSALERQLNHRGQEMGYGDVEHARSGFKDESDTVQAEGDQEDSAIVNRAEQSTGEEKPETVAKAFSLLEDSNVPLAQKMAISKHLADERLLSNEDLIRLGNIAETWGDVKADHIEKALDLARDNSLNKLLGQEDGTLYARGNKDESTQERGEPVQVTHAEDVLNRIANDSSNNSMLILVARHLLEKFGASGRLRNIPVDVYEKLEPGILGEFNMSTKRIGLESSSDAETALEEVLHSLTADRKLPAEITDLFKRIRKEAVSKGLTSEEQWTRAADPSVLNKEEGDAFHYAFSDPHELLAAALKNRSVRDALNNLEVRDSITGKLVNAWKKLKDTFKKMLGFQVKKDSALDQYLNRMFDHMAERGEPSQEERTLASRKGLTDVYNSDLAEQTLSNLNQNIYEPDRVPQISSSPSDGDSFQAAESIARGSQRAISDAQTAEPKATKARPGNRIFTSPEEAAAKAERLKINQAARPLEEAALREWAEKNGKYIDGDEFISKWEDGGVEGKDGFKSGAEHAVYFDPALQRWVKTNNLEFHGTYLDFLQRMMIHNQLFPDTAYRMEGFTDFTPYPQPGTEKRFQPVVSQGHVHALRGATRPEVARDMDSLGFRWVKNDDYISDDGSIRVEDLHEENAVVVGQNKDGSPIIAYIDPVIHLTPETKAYRVRKVLDQEKSQKLNAIRTKGSGKPLFNSPEKRTTAFDEAITSFSPELQAALKDTSYVPFTWKGDAEHVSRWLNDSTSRGATWESISLDLTSPDLVGGISERQKTVGKFMLTKSLDKAAVELKKAGNTYEAARYSKLAKTLFKSAKLDASAYGQGLNTVKMLTELVNGNTALSEYVDPISKIHQEKLAGNAEVTEILGTIKGGIEQGAEATVTKATSLLEKLSGGKGAADISRIVKEALLNPDSTPESLAAEIANAAGVSPEKAAPAAEAIRKAFTLEARKSAKLELEKLVKNAETREAKSKIKKIVESDSEKLMKLIGIGAFSEEKYYNAIAKTYGLPSWDPTFATFVEKEGEKISALPESMKDYRQQRTQRLMGEIAKKVRTEKLNNKDAGEIADLLTTFWQLGVLSGPPTQVVNAVASGASIVGESLVEGLGAAMKTGDAQHLTEVFSGFLQAITGKGGAQGVLGQEFARALKEGTSKYKNSKGETLSSMETLPNSEDLKGAMKLVSRYGNVLKYVGRSMAAFDAANMSMAEAAAERKATRYYLQTEKGLNGPKLDEAMRDLFNPEDGTVEKFRSQAEKEMEQGHYDDESPADRSRWVERRVNELLSQRRDELTGGGGISEAAIQAAERFTYNDDARGILGQFAGFMNQINQETKVSKFVISFMKTMMNLVNQTIDWSPYGFLRGSNKSFSQIRFKEGSRFDPYRYDQGSPEQYAQYARAALGTMAWAGLAYLAYKGLEDEKEGKTPMFSIHGSGPSNSFDKQQLMATRNWQPNSIRVGDHWLRYTDWPVLGIALGGMGSFFDSQRYAKDDSTMQEKLFAGAMATASTVLDKNMLQGVSNLFEGIRQSSNTAQQANALKRLVSGTVSGFTNPGLARWARNSFYADKNGMVNRLDQSTTEGWAYSMVPFSIGYNTPALNTLGEPLQQPWYSATMWRFADISGVPPHPIITPIVKSGMMLPNPSKNTEIRYLDKTGTLQKTKVGKYPEINRRFVELRGEAMKQILTPEVIGDLSRAAKENLNNAQTYLDSKIGGAARKYAVAQIEQEIADGKLHLD